MAASDGIPGFDFSNSPQPIDTADGIKNVFRAVFSADLAVATFSSSVIIKSDSFGAGNYLRLQTDVIRSEQVSAWHDSHIRGSRLIEYVANSDGSFEKITSKIVSLVGAEIQVDEHHSFRVDLDSFTLSDIAASKNLYKLVFSSQHTASTGSRGDDHIVGRNFRDIIYGNDGPDELIGGCGNDRLDGDVGDDTLVGGAGSDTLFGNGGYDEFRWTSLKEGSDLVPDFNSLYDHLAFEKDGFAGLNKHFDLVTGESPYAMHQRGTFLYDVSTHVLSYDPDGSGHAEAAMIATFSGGAHITRDAFHIL